MILTAQIPFHIREHYAAKIFMHFAVELFFDPVTEAIIRHIKRSRHDSDSFGSSLPSGLR
jgi:hypothetical protein